MSEQKVVYRCEDIDRLREQLKIGDPVRTEVWFDRLGERLMIPGRGSERSLGFTLIWWSWSPGRGEPVQTVTYAEMLVNGGVIERKPKRSRGSRGK